MRDGHEIDGGPQLEQAAIDRRVATFRHNIIEAQRRLIEEFEIFDSWSERYQYLIELGRRLAPIPEIMKTDRNRIRNCQSDAWLAGIRRNGLLYLSAASQTDVLAGLLAIAVEVYSGQPPDRILSHPLIVLEATGLRQRLSPHRLAAHAEITTRLRALAN
jgi:cysteine desulfuration protein SufE